MIPPHPQSENKNHESRNQAIRNQPIKVAIVKFPPFAGRGFNAKAKRNPRAGQSSSAPLRPT